MAISSLAEQSHALTRTNAATKFNEFSLKLKNGATLTGIVYIPPSVDGKSSPDGRPLLVAIHGATCCAYSWDVSPDYTVSKYADLNGIPVVAINRPNYLSSSGWLVDRSSDSAPATSFKAAEGASIFEEEARWYHELIFPALFKEFAVPNGCTSIVTNSHSLCTPATIIAAASYSNSPSNAGYFWAGMVHTGFGVDGYGTTVFLETAPEMATYEYDPTQLPFGQDSSVHANPFYEKQKIELMLGPPGLCDPALGPLIWRQNTPFFTEELVTSITTWPPAREMYQSQVKLPVLHAVGEYDWLWQGTRECVSAFTKDYVASPRVEAAVIEGAPHAIELAPAAVSRGWWTRVFGFAIEVDAGLRIRSLRIPGYV